MVFICTTNHSLLAARYYSAYSLLPTTYSLRLTTCCPLPTAHHQLPTPYAFLPDCLLLATAYAAHDIGPVLHGAHAEEGDVRLHEGLPVQRVVASEEEHAWLGVGGGLGVGVGLLGLGLELGLGLGLELGLGLGLAW